MKAKINMKPYYIGFAAFCGVLMIIATFWDLQIDKFLNNTENYFAVFLARFGEIPVYLIIPFTSMVFFANSKKRSVKSIISVLYGIAGWIYLCIWFGSNWFIKDDFRTAFSIIFALIFSAISFFVASKLPKDIMKKLLPFSIFAVIVALGTALSVEGIKNIWGRVRFRNMVDGGDFSSFSPWYIPQGFNGNKSFPSGHTSAASSSIILSALPYVFDYLKKDEAKIFIITAAYTFMVGFSRLIVGAHYLSDITMGAFIGFLWVIATMEFYLVKKTQSK